METYKAAPPKKSDFTSTPVVDQPIGLAPITVETITVETFAAIPTKKPMEAKKIIVTSIVVVLGIIAIVLIATKN